MITNFKNFNESSNDEKRYIFSMFHLTDYASEYIDSGRDVNITLNGESLLTNSLAQDYTDISIKLIKAGADVNFFDGYATPLFYAISYNHYDIVKLLFEYGAKLKNEPMGDDKTCELTTAILMVDPNDSHSWNIVDLLLDNGAKFYDDEFYNDDCLFTIYDNVDFSAIENEMRKRFDIDDFLKKKKANDFNL